MQQPEQLSNAPFSALHLPRASTSSAQCPRYVRRTAGGAKAEPACARPSAQPPAAGTAATAAKAASGARESVPRSSPRGSMPYSAHPSESACNLVRQHQPCAPQLALSLARRLAPLLVAPLPGADPCGCGARAALPPQIHLNGSVWALPPALIRPDLCAHNSSGATRTAATAAALSASSSAGAWSKAGMGVAATLGAGLVLVRWSR